MDGSWFYVIKGGKLWRENEINIFAESRPTRRDKELEELLIVQYKVETESAS